MHETQLRLVIRLKGDEPQVFAMHETHGTSIALALKPCNDRGHVHGEEDPMEGHGREIIMEGNRR